MFDIGGGITSTASAIAAAARRAAAAITERRRTEATEALNTYNEKVETHQRNWAAQNQGKYNTQAAAEAAWREAWQVDGEEARAELMPHIVAFEEAVRNELRLAVEEVPGGDQAAAVDQALTEIKGRENGGYADTTLDSLSDEAAAPIRTESTEARQAAIDVYEKTQAFTETADQLDGVYTRIDAAQDESTFASLDSERIPLEDRLATEQQDLLDSVDNELSIRIADGVVADAEASLETLRNTPGVNQFELREAREILAAARAQQESVNAGGTPVIFTDEQLAAAKQAFGVAHGGNLMPAVEYAGAQARIRQELDAGSSVCYVDESHPESVLGEKDPVTAAFLREAGVRIDLDAEGMSEQEKNLARSDPFVFGLLQLGGVEIDATEVGTPVVTIGDRTITLTDEQKQLFDQDNIQAFAWTLLPQVQLDPNTQMLMAATSGVRRDYVTEQMDRLMGGSEQRPLEALEMLSTNLNATFSPQERQALWEAAGAPHFNEAFFREQFNDILERPDPSSTNPDDIRALNDGRSHMDRIGTDILQPYAQVAPPEVAGVMLDTVKSEFSEDWYDSHGSSYGTTPAGVEFYKGLSGLVELQPDRAGEFARWISDGADDNPAGTLIYNLRGSDMGYGFDGIRQTISDGFGATLSDAVYSRVENSDDLSQFEPDLDLRIDQGKEDAQEDLVRNVLRDEYVQFNENPMEIVQPYFDQFLGDPNIGHQVTIESDTQLRNIIGRTLGLTPTNEAAALNGDYSVEWYAEGSAARAQIDLIAGWVKNEGGDRPTITALPMIYAAESAGVQEGALFKVHKGDGEEVVIDGSVADDVIAMDDDHQVSADDDTDLPYKYDSVDNFLDDNQYDTGGYIWLPENYNIADLNEDDHVEVARMEAARVTGGERFKMYADIGIGVVATVGGIALTPFTGGTSLAVTAAAWTAVGAGVAWGTYRSIDELQNMNSHGQTLSFGNAQARSAWLGLIGSGLSVTAIGSGFRATALAGRATTAGLAVDDASALLGAAQRYSTASRLTGTGAFAVGAEQTGELGINLANNWDRMSAEERATNLLFMGMGVTDMGVGVWSHYHARSMPAAATGEGTAPAADGANLPERIVLHPDEILSPGEFPDVANGGEPPQYRSGSNLLDYLRSIAHDNHAHHGGMNEGSYRLLLDDPNAPSPDGLRTVLTITGHPDDPSRGPILAIQRVPQSIAEQAGYYLGRESPTAVRPQEFELLLHSDGRFEIPNDVTYFSMGPIPRTIEGGQFRLGEGGILWDSGMPPAPPAAGEPPIRFKVNIIPDLEMTYRGTQRDVGLVDEVVTLPDELAGRVMVGSVAADPADPRNVNQLLGILNYVNQVEGNNPGKVRVFGIGEWTLSKEGVIVNLALKPDLHNPQAIHQLLDVVGQMRRPGDERGGAVVVHTDAGSPNMITLPNGERLLLHRESNYENVDALLDIFRAHPDVEIIWAHAGGLGRSGSPGRDHIQMLRDRILNDPDMSHVSIDLSWDVVANHVVQDMSGWTDLVREFPDRFIHGSDSVSARTAEVQYAALDIYDREGFIEALGPEVAEQFLNTNFERVFGGAAERVTAWRLANAEWLRQFPWDPGDGTAAANPFDPQGPLGPTGGLWVPPGARLPASDGVPASRVDGPDNSGGSALLGLGLPVLGAADPATIMAAPAQQGTSPFDLFNPVLDGSPASTMNSGAFALRGGLIVLKAMYGGKLPSLAADQPMGILLRSGLLGTYMVNDTIFAQWLANGGPSGGSAMNLMETAFLMGFGAGNTLLTGTTAAELFGGARGMNWDTPTTTRIRAMGMSLLAAVSPIWTTHTGMNAIEQFASGHPVRGSALSAATLMESIFTAGMGRAAFNEWMKTVNPSWLGSTNLTKPHIMLGAALFFAAGINMGLGIYDLLTDGDQQPDNPLRTPTPTPTPTSPPPSTTPPTTTPVPTVTASIAPTTSPGGP